MVRSSGHAGFFEGSVSKKREAEVHPLCKAAREVRLAVGETQQQFAARMQAAIRTIARYETVRPPASRALIKYRIVAEHAAGRPDLAKLFENAYEGEIGRGPGDLQHVWDEDRFGPAVRTKNDNELGWAHAILRVLRDEKYASIRPELARLLLPAMEDGLAESRQKLDRINTILMNASLRGYYGRPYSDWPVKQADTPAPAAEADFDPQTALKTGLRDIVFYPTDEQDQFRSAISPLLLSAASHVDEHRRALLFTELKAILYNASLGLADRDEKQVRRALTRLDVRISEPECAAAIKSAWNENRAAILTFFGFDRDEI